jgi:hypothetical protein
MIHSLSPQKLANLLKARQELEDKYFGSDAPITQMPRNPFPMHQMVVLPLVSIGANKKPDNYYHWYAYEETEFPITVNHFGKTIKTSHKISTYRFEAEGFSSAEEAKNDWLSKHALSVRDILQYGREHKWRLPSSEIGALNFIQVSLEKALSLYPNLKSSCGKNKTTGCKAMFYHFESLD